MKKLNFLLNRGLSLVNGPTLDRHWTDNGPSKLIVLLCFLFTLGIGYAWGVSNGDRFVQITSVSDLSNGDEVIIVNQDETYTLSSTDAGNYRARVSISTSSHSYTYSSSDGVQVLKVKIDGDYIGFHTGSGFLQVPSNNNYLSTSSALYTESLTDNSRWSLTVNDVNASGDYVCWLEVKKTWTSSGKTVYRYLQYNSGDSRFASYKDTQEDCLIYKKTAASCSTNPDVGNASLNGTLNLTVHFLLVIPLIKPHETRNHWMRITSEEYRILPLPIIYIVYYPVILSLHFFTYLFSLCQRSFALSGFCEHKSNQQLVPCRAALLTLRNPQTPRGK